MAGDTEDRVTQLRLVAELAADLEQVEKQPG
jgi:hypothetical protein